MKVLNVQYLNNRLRTRRASSVKKDVQGIVRYVNDSNSETRRNTRRGLTRARRSVTRRTRRANRVTVNNTSTKVLQEVKATCGGAGRGLHRGDSFRTTRFRHARYPSDVTFCFVILGTFRGFRPVAPSVGPNYHAGDPNNRTITKTFQEF